MRSRLGLLGLVLALVVGCESTDHDSIDKWMRTEKGPAKLAKVMSDPEVDPDLSAHAAQNIARIGRDRDVATAIGQLSPERRSLVMAALAPRLWTLARVEGEMTMPTPQQVAAKDLLFDLRDKGSQELHAQIDDYLVDWYTSGYFEGRAKMGRYLGVTILAKVGPVAGKRLIAAANRVIGPSDVQGTKRPRLGDETLLALAAVGAPETVEYLIDLAGNTRGDDTLTDRAIDALFRAHSEPEGMFDIVDAKPLIPSLPWLARMAKDPAQSARVANNAIALIRATGRPHCVEPLLGMLGTTHPNPRFHWVASNQALRCGGVEAIDPVLRAAANPGGDYERELLDAYVWGEIARMPGRDAVLAALRSHLGSSNWVARWIAVEALVAMGSREDAGRLRQLRGDGQRLLGYWGDQSGLPAKQRKPEPTLGGRVGELLTKLESGT